MTITEKTKGKTKLQIKLEKQEKERAYEQALKVFKHKFAQTMQMTKEDLEQLAHKLEKADTVRLDLICQRIIEDLEPEILMGQITDQFIWRSLPAKYKQADRSITGSRRWGEYAGGDLTKKLYAVLEDWTRLDQSSIVVGTVENAVRDSQDYRSRTLQRMNDKQINETVIAATFLSAVMDDLSNIGKDLQKQRQSSGKLWTR